MWNECFDEETHVINEEITDAESSDGPELDGTGNDTIFLLRDL